MAEPIPGRTCRGCGCTDDNACDGGCYWVEPDLCSQCAIATVVRKPFIPITDKKFYPEEDL